MKTFLRSFVVLAIAAFAFSCAPEENVELLEDQADFRLTRPFIGDIDQTPQNAYIRADVSPLLTGRTISCPGPSTNYEDFTLRVLRGALVSGIGNNPALRVRVSINDGNNSPIYITAFVPEDSLDVLMPLSQIDPNGPSMITYLENLDGPVVVSVMSILAQDNQSDVSQYYAHSNTVANLGCQ